MRTKDFMKPKAFSSEAVLGCPVYVSSEVVLFGFRFFFKFTVFSLALKVNSKTMQKPGGIPPGLPL